MCVVFRVQLNCSTMRFFTRILVVLMFVSAQGTPDPKDIVRSMSRGVEKLILTGHAPQSLREATNDFKKIREKSVADETFCVTCQNVINRVIEYRKSGSSRDSMIHLLRNLCMAFTDWGRVACEGYIDIEIDTAIYIIDNNQNLTSDRACAIYFQPRKCEDPNASNWTIPLPPLRHIGRDTNEVAESLEPLKILHLTDFHYDPLYLPGSNADCDEPLCCQSGKPSNSSNAAGYWGDYHVCDMPWHSVTNVLSYINNLKVDFDFAYYTGDIISHKSWTTSREANTESIRVLLKLFRTTWKNLTFYPILGNHEPHPTDFYSPDNLKNAKVSTQWIFDLVADEWAHWLPEDETRNTILQGGFYTVLVKPGFRVIALNSNVCFTSNLWLMYDDVDPLGQLKWLVNVLTEAEGNNEKVHILSHIPPGEVSCHKQWSYQFQRIVNRFAKTISAQFNGHTHLDEIRVFQNSSNPGQAINVAFNAGSFTTFVGMNPNFRYYYVEPKDYTVTDYDHFVYNLTQANQNSPQEPEWYKLYSFKEAYGLKSLGFNDLEKFVENLSNEDIIKKYRRFQFRDSDVQVNQPCGEQCLERIRCSVTAINTKEAVDCLDS